MKLTTLVIFAIISSITSAGLMRVLKKEGDLLCTKLSNTKQPIDTNVDVFPQDTQKTGVAFAEQQVKAARAMFYNPDAPVLAVLKTAAINFRDTYVNKEKVEFADMLLKSWDGKKKEGVNRQIGVGGSLEYKQMYESLPDEEKKVKIKDYLLNQIQVVADGKGKARDYVGFVCLLGDMGAVLLDYFGKEKKPTPDEMKVVEALKNHPVVSKLDPPTVEAVAKEAFKYGSPNHFYDDDPKTPKIIGKQLERDMCVTEGSGFPLRSGVFDLGEKIDKELKQKDTIPAIGWPLQTVKKKLIDTCPQEPWTGHFSGSLYEVMFMLDLLSGDDHLEFKENEERKAKAAIAAGMLVATGFHSAVEEVFVVKKYLGLIKPDTRINTETNKDDYCKDATKYMSDLFAQFTKKSKKRILRKK